MKKVFLSHSFAPRDRELVTHVEALIRSHGLIATDGQRLAGGPLTDEVRQLIADADALVAVVSVREGDPANLTSPWVIQELGHARLGQKPAIGLYETGLPVAAIQGADAGHEHIEFDRAALLGAFLALSETLGEWKRRAGRLIKVVVVPKDVELTLGPRVDQLRCEFRFHTQGKESQWQEANVKREVGGVIVYLRIPDDVDMVQLRTDGPRAYESAYTPVWMPVHFEPRQ